MAVSPVPDCAPRRTALIVGCCTGICAVLIYFLCALPLFVGGTQSLGYWLWQAWNPMNHQEHSRFVLPICAGLLWWHRHRLASAPRAPSMAGLVPVALGIACFLAAVRTAQPRLAVLTLPLVCWGGTVFVWGWQVASVCRFPFCFLLLMMPLGNYVQGTVSLQLLVSGACNLLAPLAGLQIEVAGTTIRSADGSFHFEIAEGCSGVRSLMSILMLAALYVHFSQPILWKKIAVFCGSLLFSVIGNIARIFSVLVAARLFGPGWAGGLYHDYSDFVFFPAAVGAMMGFNHWISRDWSRLAPRPAADAGPAETPYDY
jgi:exosortase